jgi:lipopolysaccharide export system protein LptA
MKISRMPRPALLMVVLVLTWVPAMAQNTDDSDVETPPPGATVITSDELHSDQQNHISIFTGNVITVGTNFKMTCQEMTVNFTSDNKVDTIIATGDVIIIQPDRVTHCGRAEYFHDEDKFDLTDQPVILDHKNTVRGPEIIIFRTTQKMIVKGGRSTTIISKENMGSSTATAPSTESK